MKRLLFLFVILLSATVVLAKVNQSKPRYSKSKVPAEKACNEKRRAFPHKAHTAMSMKCAECHEEVTADNAVQGEKVGDLRRPDHAACLSCHGEGKAAGLTFFETDDAKRTLCVSCHTPREDADGKPIEGTENDPAAAPGAIDYADPREKPCDVTFGFEFNHITHMESGTCGDCHGVLTDKDPKAGMIVKGPGHLQCFRCHQAGANKKASAAAVAKDCAACHPFEGRLQAKISYVSGGRADHFFKLSHQSHIKTFEAAYPNKGQNEICAACHTSPQRSWSLFDTTTLSERDKGLSAACFCCHYDKSPVAFGTSGCTSCHANLSSFTTPSSHTKQSCSF